MQAKAQAEREKAMAENAEASAKWLAEVETMEGVKKTESGILYRIDREGSEVMATEDTDVVLVNYEGKTSDGEVFDSSYERGEPISFPLNRVIKGWTEGMKLVGVGGQITLWIPSELAYGERGAGANIGPNQALEFKVELLEVNPEN
jgi:FKBP-type peptidyl-prolyl cis-trans isomerase FkpA